MVYGICVSNSSSLNSFLYALFSILYALCCIGTHTGPQSNTHRVKYVASGASSSGAGGGAPTHTQQTQQGGGALRAKMGGDAAMAAAVAAAGRCHVIESHKMRLFIYIPLTKSGLLTLFTYADWSFYL
jgi:hypothetical protein